MFLGIKQFTYPLILSIALWVGVSAERELQGRIEGAAEFTPTSYPARRFYYVSYSFAFGALQVLVA